MNDLSHNPLERLRNQVIDQLSTSYSHDVLSQEEFEERVETATAAGSHAELRALIIDLPVPAPNQENQDANLQDYHLSHESDPQQRSINRSGVDDERTLLAFFSGTERRGVWHPPRKLNTIAVFGGSDIDLRDAMIPAEGMRIVAFALFGGVDIVVPEGVRVSVDGIGIFGGFGGTEYAAPDAANSPVIKVEGVALFGGVEVRVKRRRKR